jgi:hypothetical protein
MKNDAKYLSYKAAWSGSNRRTKQVLPGIGRPVRKHHV